MNLTDCPNTNTKWSLNTEHYKTALDMQPFDRVQKKSNPVSTFGNQQKFFFVRSNCLLYGMSLSCEPF